MLFTFNNKINEVVEMKNYKIYKKAKLVYCDEKYIHNYTNY